MCRTLAAVLCLTTLSGLSSGAARAAGNESPAVEVPVHAGDRLEAVLTRLNESGFRIVYSSALVRPEMTLSKAPSSSHIEELLREILAPWNLRAVRASNGDWLIGPGTSAAPLPPEVSIVPAEDITVIDVTASRLRLAVDGASETFLARADVERMPHLADDALRMLKVLPGVSGGDFSAALNIRGGRRDEALLTIDGAEIHNGFHFRDIDGALSVLDTNLVEGIDFTTGGMTADVGDYMSGVVGLQTRRPTADDEYRSGVGISFVSAYGRSSGTFANDRGWWLASARRGFLDVLTEKLVADNEQLTPRYTDVFLAAGFDLGERTSLDARFLLSDDDLRFITDDAVDDADSAGKGHSQHLWFTLNHDFSENLHSRTLLAAATVEQRRDSGGSNSRRFGLVHSDEDFRFLDLRQDWSWALGSDQLPRWGFNVSKQRGNYDYSLLAQIHDLLVSETPIDKSYATKMDVGLTKIGVYGAWRTRLTESFSAELGIRRDQYRYDDAVYAATSPRVNLVWSLGERGELRAAWGVNHQPQAVNELQVEDDVTRFLPPERVRQAVLGYTHRFSHGLSARVDLYDKQYDGLRPRFENALDPVQLIPEGASDRVRIDAPVARARGVEITVRREAASGLAGWLSLALGRAEDREAGDWRPRSWEYRQALSFGGSWTGAKWNVSFAGLAHSGTPTTSIGIATTRLPGGGFDVEGMVGPRNGERLDPYARLDLRVNRDVRLANGKLSFYFEVTNLLDRKNECCVDTYHVRPGRDDTLYLDLEEGYWLPILPSFGFQWEF
jgi:hypothetical protein